MRRRTTVLAAVAATVLAIYAVFRFRSEPISQGITLTEHIDHYAALASLDEPTINWLTQSPEPVPPAPPAAQEDAQAIRQMAPKAIPLLIGWMQTRAQPPANHEQDKRIYRAFVGLLVLKENASSFIPELGKIAADPQAPGSPFAIRLLGEIGSAGLPGLTNVLVSPVQTVIKQRTLKALSQIPPGPALALPTLLQALNHPDGHIARDSAQLLGELRLEPGAVIPALTTALERKEYYVRIAAARALANYGDQSRPVLPKLLTTMRNIEPQARPYIAEAIHQIAPEALTNALAQ